MLRLSILIAVALFSVTTRAQICNGSLGDPAVNLTFGTAGNTGPSAFVPSSSYIYQSSACPNDGYYTITSSSADCFGNSWHFVTGDHTGGGNFMLVNASYQPGDFFVDSVTDLCPNTTYEFAAWVMNVMKPVNSILPNLTFSIETPTGSLLGQFHTGDIAVTAAPLWQQYGLFFTTPATNAKIVLRITNNAPGGIGNDLALDDITFRPCGEKVSATIQGSSNDTINICEGNTNSYTFKSGISSAYISPVFQWQVSKDSANSWQDIAGADTPSYTRLPTGAGSYWYRLTVTEASSAGISSCRIASNLVIINVHAKPVVDAGPDRVYIVGYPVTLPGVVAGEEPTYTWSPAISISDINVLNPVVSPPADITYILSAFSSFGCMNEDSVHVKVVAGIFVPTAFTPNGDGKNDTWNIPFLDPSFGAEVSVFNRWGQLVYHITGSTVSWDGTINGVPQSPGTYVYLVIFKNAPFKMMSGTLTLIR
ncbi:MAG: gliding motility-associated C-terminal domain-containing protein [Bacteroidota bacterium]|nr:gliding motility-associated C-terminal domain-containing protein [Bacteroidota bacterium]